MKNIDNKFVTKCECLERGGHFWNYFTNKDVVDEYGRTSRDILLSISSGTTINKRKCGLCGLLEIEKLAEWEEQS